MCLSDKCDLQNFKADRAADNRPRAVNMEIKYVLEVKCSTGVLSRGGVCNLLAAARCSLLWSLSAGGPGCGCDCGAVGGFYLRTPLQQPLCDGTQDLKHSQPLLVHSSLVSGPVCS